MWKTDGELILIGKPQNQRWLAGKKNSIIWCPKTPETENNLDVTDTNLRSLPVPGSPDETGREDLEWSDEKDKEWEKENEREKVLELKQRKGR